VNEGEQNKFECVLGMMPHIFDDVGYRSNEFEDGQNEKLFVSISTYNEFES
jgi:hypothetical protein